MNYRECYEEGRAALDSAGISEAELDARLLLEYVCRTDRNTLLVRGDRDVADEDRARYVDLIAGRAGHIPLQYLTGIQEFMGLKFRVNEHVLIPRQDTEILVEEVLKNLHDGMRVLDMCTGSGCILISLLHYSNGCSGVGVDLSGEALAVARENARAGEEDAVLCEGSAAFCEDSGRAPGNMEFIQSNLFEHVAGKFEIIVSNPPYIERDVLDTLMPEVKDHEPMMALDGGKDGLDFYREIVRGSREHLMGGGMLFFEIGYNQGEAVRTLMEQSGFAAVEIVKDYAGLDRVVYGTLTTGGMSGQNVGR